MYRVKLGVEKITATIKIDLPFCIRVQALIKNILNEFWS